MSTFKFGVAVIVLATALNPPANITVVTSTLACPNIPRLACASWQ